MRIDDPKEREERRQAEWASAIHKAFEAARSYEMISADYTKAMLSLLTVAFSGGLLAIPSFFLDDYLSRSCFYQLTIQVGAFCFLIGLMLSLLSFGYMSLSFLHKSIICRLDAIPHNFTNDSAIETLKSLKEDRFKEFLKEDEVELAETALFMIEKINENYETINRHSIRAGKIVSCLVGSAFFLFVTGVISISLAVVWS